MTDSNEKPAVCLTCRFWNFIDSTDSQCRRRCPNLTFPITNALESCGEHEPCIDLEISRRKVGIQLVRKLDGGKNAG